MKNPLWRVTSDYIGAGRFVVTQDRVVVGTDYGVQCLPRPRGGAAGKAAGRGDAGPAWKAQLGSRCVGLISWDEHATIAACLKGLFVLSDAGDQRWGTHSLRELIHAPVPLRGGILMTTASAVHYVEEWNGPKWRFDFAEVLGTSVELIRLVNLFELDGHIVAGAVDYDSGIGRVIVLDGRTGRRQWVSDPGPVSDLFPAGQAVFVWCQTGYGKFETRMTRLDGHEIWQKDFAGLGAVRPDGAIAMVVGSNESPAWDDWEYRLVGANGKVEMAVRGTGRCNVRPVVKKDGTVYFLGSVLPVDLGSSRVDYTSFFAMPQEVVYQHLTGVKSALPEYDITLHRVKPNEKTLEAIYQVSGSYAFAEMQLLGNELILSDGPDIVAVEA